MFGDGVQLDLEGWQAVGHGFEIGHGAHGGVAAGGGSRRAGVNGLLIRKTRLPKMNMNINETWNKEMVMQFNDRKAVPGKGGGNRNNTALVDGDISGLERAVKENGSAGKQQTHGISPSSCIHSTYYNIGKHHGCQREIAG